MGWERGKRKRKENHKTEGDGGSELGREVRMDDATGQVPCAGHFTLPWDLYPVLGPRTPAQLFSMTQNSSPLFLSQRIHLSCGPGPPLSPLGSLPRFLEAETVPPSSLQPGSLGGPQTSHPRLQLVLRGLSATLDSELLRERDSVLFFSASIAGKTGVGIGPNKCLLGGEKKRTNEML